MNSSEPPGPDSAVEKQLRLAVRMRDRRNWIGLGAFLLCFFPGLIWMMFVDSSETGKNYFFIGICASGVVGVLVSSIFARQKAACPDCGYLWDIDDFVDSKAREWKHCPGCGLKMDK